LDLAKSLLIDLLWLNINIILGGEGRGVLEPSVSVLVILTFVSCAISEVAFSKASFARSSLLAEALSFVIPLLAEALSFVIPLLAEALSISFVISLLAGNARGK